MAGQRIVSLAGDTYAIGAEVDGKIVQFTREKDVPYFEVPPPVAERLLATPTQWIPWTGNLPAHITAEVQGRLQARPAAEKARR